MNTFWVYSLNFRFVLPSVCTIISYQQIGQLNYVAFDMNGKVKVLNYHIVNY